MDMIANFDCDQCGDHRVTPRLIEKVVHLLVLKLFLNFEWSSPILVNSTSLSVVLNCQTASSNLVTSLVITSSSRIS